MSGLDFGGVGNFITDFTSIFTGRRDRDHAEHRDDRLRAFDNARQERLDNTVIQRRVDDARNAGIHPLAALGAQVSSPAISGSSPSPVPNYPQFRSGSDSGASAVNAAQVRHLDAQTSWVGEQIEASRLARATQSVTPDKRSPVVVTEPMEEKMLQPNKNIVHTPYFDLQLRPWSKSSDVEDETGDVGDSTIGIMRVIDSVLHQVFKDMPGALRGVRAYMRQDLKSNTDTRHGRKYIMNRR